MNREEYDLEVKRLTDILRSFNIKKNEVENEYNALLRSDKRWIEAIDGIIQARKEMAELTYDDNRVYRTGERQLDTRVDGGVEHGEAMQTINNLIPFINPIT